MCLVAEMDCNRLLNATSVCRGVVDLTLELTLLLALAYLMELVLWLG